MKGWLVMKDTLTPKQMALLMEHLTKEEDLRKEIEERDGEIIDLMSMYYEMDYQYRRLELSPEAQEQYEALQEAMEDAALERQRVQEELEEAAEEDEEPLVQGRWAQIRRSYLQSYRPREWLDLLSSRQASVYLEKVEQETQRRYQEMYQREEARQILGKNLSFLQEVQCSQMIEAQIREILIADLSC